MVITKTPFRISFFGGGTDYPSWYERTGKGAVLSTTIDKYCYLNCRYLPPFFKYKHRIVYSKQEFVNKFESIKNSSARESLKLVKPDRGVEVHYVGDLPAQSGLGSSSAFTVGLLNGLYSLQGEIKSKKELALDAIHVEQNMIKTNVGSQDQTAASFGGLNKIEFKKGGNITPSPIIMADDKLADFQDHLMLFFTDFTRDSSNIARGWIKNTSKNEDDLKIFLKMVDEGVGILTSKKDNLDDFGKLLHEHWQIKRGLAPKITTSKIDEIYKAGIEAGALGGKLLGAGGGGFILFFAKPEAQPKIREKLKKFLYVPFKFDHGGTQVIYLGNHDPF